jgi:hypothetical protein
MSLYQTPFESPTWAAEFALVKDELLLAFKRHVVVDALFVLRWSFCPWLG